jgi:hypothetical protein
MWVLLSLDGVVVGPDALQAAAAATAGRYLEEICCISDGHRLVTPTLLDALLRAGGFDDPWDLSAALVLFFLSGLSPALRPPLARPSRAADVQEAFRDRNLRYGELMSHAERDLEPLIAQIQQRGGGLRALHVALGHDSVETWILRRGALDAAHRQHTLPPTATRAERDAADNAPDNLLGRLFEQTWLGPDRFLDIHGFPTAPPPSPPLFDHERPLLTPDDLHALSLRASVAALTRRTAREADLLLQHLGLATAFAFTQAPPQPQGRASTLPLEPATAIIRAQDPATPIIFVSARPDELTQARALGLRVIGFAHQRTLRKPLQDAGAEAVISRLDTLTRSLS